jgi:peptidoglycan/xylan/chitin deacetylase (PgdA/CDA1 family)
MPTRHSRGVYGAEKGAPRLLDLHDKYDVPATWFVPGHTIDSFPEICGEVYDRGYDIQHHGWSHTGPATYDSKEDEKADVDRADYSANTLEILDEVGIEWDSSKMASDFEPHWVYGDWSAPEDGPYDRGEPTDIVELPVSWQRDDWPALTFTWARPHRMGYVSEDSLFQRYYDQFDWMHEHVDDGVFILTMHPQVIGQAHRISRLEELIQYMMQKDDVEFMEMDAVAQQFRENN